MTDPLQSKRAQAVLKAVRKLFLELPETSEEKQFGSPVWKAGKKTFALISGYDKQIKLGFWVGADQQGLVARSPSSPQLAISAQLESIPASRS